MFKAQKGSKDIIKIVNVTSVVQPYCYEATRILFVCKENKNNDFVQQFLLFHVSCRHVHVSTMTHTCAFICFFLALLKHTLIRICGVSSLASLLSILLSFSLPHSTVCFLSTAISVSVICWGTFSFASELLNHNCDFKRVIKVKCGPDELLLQEMLWY